MRLVQRLLEFIEKSPTSFHAVEQVRQELLEHGFQELREQEMWRLKQGGQYFVTRNQSSLIAFQVPRGEI